MVSVVSGGGNSLVFRDAGWVVSGGAARSAPPAHLAGLDALGGSQSNASSNDRRCVVVRMNVRSDRGDTVLSQPTGHECRSFLCKTLMLVPCADHPRDLGLKSAGHAGDSGLNVANRT